jgi:hypothetical protein
MYIAEYLEPESHDDRWEIDALLCGNEMRFINYSNVSEEANVEAVCVIREGRNEVGVDIHTCTLVHNIYTHTQSDTNAQIAHAHSHTGI